MTAAPAILFSALAMTLIVCAISSRLFASDSKRPPTSVNSPPQRRAEVFALLRTANAVGVIFACQ